MLPWSGLWLICPGDLVTARWNGYGQSRGDDHNGGHMTTTQEPDPFGAAPPVATGGASGPRASFGLRLGAYLIDSVIIFVAYFILALIHPALGILAALAGIGYFIYFEGGPTGQTIGKKTVGIRVIDFATGGPIGYGRGFLRYIGRIPSSIFLLGYLWMLWDPEKQTWHDKIATTVVVPVESYPVA
jgi:uncharacterized RDD family membrane protein YckC